MGRLTELAQRRAQLQLQAAAQRAELGAHVNAIHTQLGFVDQGLTRLRSLLPKPVLVACGAAVALFVGPVRSLRLLGKGVLLISGARRLLRWFS